MFLYYFLKILKKKGKVNRNKKSLEYNSRLHLNQNNNSKL